MSDDRPRDYKGFRSALLAAGAFLNRKTGGHEQWRLPNGHNFTLPPQASRRDWMRRRDVLNRWRDLVRLLALPKKGDN